MLQSVEQGTVQQGAMLAGPVAINTHLFNFYSVSSLGGLEELNDLISADSFLLTLPQ